MKTLAVTLARGGSKGIPKKNIYLVNGRPLIDYTFDAVRNSTLITEYVVSTDDDEIKAHCDTMGVRVVPRPKEYARSGSPSLDALRHAVRYLEDLGESFDIVADIRATNPLKTQGDIDGAIAMLMRTGAQSVIGVSPATPVERIKRLEEDRIVSILFEPEDGQRQFLQPCYVRNGSLYVLWRDELMNGKLFGHQDSRAWVMPKERSVNIDDMHDLKVAEMYLQT